jgi:hypothetical protein
VAITETGSATFFTNIRQHWKKEIDKAAEATVQSGSAPPSTASPADLRRRKIRDFGMKCGDFYWLNVDEREIGRHDVLSNTPFAAMLVNCIHRALARRRERLWKDVVDVAKWRDTRARRDQHTRELRVKWDPRTGKHYADGLRTTK